MRGIFAKLWHDRRWPWRLARMLLLFVILGNLLPVLLENRLIYIPTKWPDGDWEAPTKIPADGAVYPKVEEVWLTTSDGVKLHAWYCHPSRREAGQDQPLTPMATLLWCHGNAGNLTHRYRKIYRLCNLPVAILIFDYRGYGRSEGSPNEEGVYRDAAAAWQYLTVERQVPAEQVIIYGVSLGGSVATQLTTQVKPAGLVLESTFTSIPKMARELYPILPRFLLHHRMDTEARIATLTLPKLIIHGAADEVIPVTMGRRLHEVAPEPKVYFEVPDAGHEDVDYEGGALYLEVWRRFIESCVPQTPP
jgi:uncharacterized protein